MFAGLPFLMSAIYGTFIVAFVMTVLELDFSTGTLWHTMRRWGKFLLLLVILAIVIQILSVL